MIKKPAIKKPAYYLISSTAYVDPLSARGNPGSAVRIVYLPSVRPVERRQTKDKTTGILVSLPSRGRPLPRAQVDRRRPLEEAGAGIQVKNLLDREVVPREDRAPAPDPLVTATPQAPVTAIPQASQFPAPSPPITATLQVSRYQVWRSSSAPLRSFSSMERSETSALSSDRFA